MQVSAGGTGEWMHKKDLKKKKKKEWEKKKVMRWGYIYKCISCMSVVLLKQKKPPSFLVSVLC